MKNKLLILTSLSVLTCFLFSSIGCSTKKDDVTTPAGPNEASSFTFSPIDVSNIKFNYSLGWINPPAHIIPTDHVYIHYNNPSTTAGLPLIAPGGGLVQKILIVPNLSVNECKVWIQMNPLFTYYLDHVLLNNTIKEGVAIKAGQVIGTTGLGDSFDLGVIDSTVTIPFANPARHGWQTIHCGKPYSYFTEPLRSQMYALVDREGSEKDGWVNVDVPKTLSGNWFLDGPTFYTDGGDWDKELAFAYDIQHPSKVQIALGGVIGPAGKWYPQIGALLPSQVTVSTGKVAYQLWSLDPVTQAINTEQKGLMIVQMIDDTHIKVEMFADVKIADASFTGNAKMYAR